MPVEIGGITLNRIHKLATLEHADFANHRVPGLEGTLVQDMGRHSVRICIEGIYYGANAKDDLETLRTIYKERTPIDFLADVVGETYFSEVIIETFEVVQRAEEPEQFSFLLMVAEYVPPPEPLSSLGLPDIDTGILDDAMDFMDALEIPDLLSLPEFSDPLKPMNGLLDGLGDNLSPIEENSEDFTEPNVFSNLNENIQNNSLDANLSNQNAAVGNIQSAFDDISSNADASINDLANQLNDQSLDVVALDDYSQSINDIQNRMPTDASNIIQPVSDGLAGLQGQIQSRLSGSIGSAKASFESSVQVLRMFGEQEKSTNVSAGPMVRMMHHANKPDFVANINAVSDFIDTFPGPVNAEQFIAALQRLMSGLPRDLLEVPSIPYVDELRQVLETAINWRSATANQIADQLASTLTAGSSFVTTQVDQIFQPILTKSEEFQVQFDHVILGLNLQRFDQQLTALKEGIEQNQVSSVQAALSQLPTIQSQILVQLQELEEQFLDTTLQELLQHVNSLPGDLMQMMTLILRTLSPDSKMASLGEKIQGYLQRVNEENFLSDLNEPLENVANEITAVFDRLDLSVIQEPIATASNELGDVVDELENAKAEVLSRISLLFDELESLIDQIDFTEITDKITAAIQHVQQEIQQSIDQLFAPIRQVISEAVDAIDSAIDNFDPEEILDALRGAITDATDLLTSQEVLDQLERIKDLLEQVSSSLDNFSFKVVNDLVIEQIDQITASLRSIDLSVLNDLLKDSLKVAIDVLPKEAAFNALRNELVEKAQFILEEGPVKLLDEAKGQPARIRQQLELFSPASLLGDSLSKPFNQLIDQMDQFSFVNLLQPVEVAIDQLKEKIVEEASPVKLLAPVQSIFDEVLAGIDQLNPAALIAPLSAALEQAINFVIEVLPVDEFFDLVNEVLERIQSIFEIVTAVKDLMEKVTGFLGNLTDVDDQVDTWVGDIVNKVENLGDSSAIISAFEELRSRIDLTSSANLNANLLPGMESLIAVISQLAPQQNLNKLILHYQNLKVLSLDTLDASTQTEVLNFLNSFNPLDISMNRPLSGLQNFLDQLNDKKQIVIDQLDQWDEIYHTADAPLSLLVPDTLNAAAIRTLLQESIERILTNPIKEIFKLLEPIGQTINILLSPVNHLFTAIDSKIGVLINGPASLTAIRDALEALVDKIRGFNLEFLITELNDVFDLIKSKLNRISPAQLILALDRAFQGLLDSLNLDQLIPSDTLDDLNQSFLDVQNKLRQLDPTKIIVEVIEPEFEETIAPFLETFDLTEILESLSELLNRIQEELDDELKRTQTSFIGMLEAIPFQQ